MGATLTLASFVAQPCPGLFSVEAINVAKTSVRDGIAVGVHAAGTPFAETLRSGFAGDEGTFSVLGTDWTFGARTSVEMNGALIHAEDWDDMGGCGGHPTASLLPSLLGVAQRRKLSGEEFLRAYIVGYHCGTALMRNIYMGYRGFDRPWHPSSVIGPIAAVCACAAASQLSAEETVAALGIAASRSGGLRCSFGTDAKPLQLGNSAASGFLAVALAQAGAAGDPEVLERENGYLSCFAPKADLRYLQHDLDRHRYMEYDDERFTSGSRPKIKEWPVCGGNDLALTVASGLLRGEKYTESEIARITVAESVDRSKVSLFRVTPRRGLEGKFSLRYVMAVLVYYGNVFPEAFTESTMQHLLSEGLLEKIVVAPEKDPTMAVDDIRCRVTIEFSNGLVRSGIAHGRGKLLDDVGSLEKFRGCVTPRLGADQAEELNTTLSSLERVDDVMAILDLARPAVSGAR